MTRDILIQPQHQPAQQRQPISYTQSTVAPQQVPAPAREMKDALVGAFPEWDLLPAVQFVRRVK